jgi:ADP-ribosylglycohydrolase
MLLEMAIGDAYGAGFEYAKPEFVSANNDLTRYVAHQKHRLTPGSYTDDTQMSIANAEVILSGDLTREAYADAYVRCFKRDQRLGYAGRFYTFLCEIQDGTEFLARIVANSDKSGGAMRALPFGIFPDVKDVIAHSLLQAAITHNTVDGVNAAVAAALMSHYFLYSLGPKKELSGFIQKLVPGDWAVEYTEPVGEKGWMSVRAAITAVLQSDSMSQLLRRCCDFTGDVDTVAALALGAAAASPEVKQDLPAFLYDNLENGKYGRDFLKDLDDKLATRMLQLRNVRA